MLPYLAHSNKVNKNEQTTFMPLRSKLDPFFFKKWPNLYGLVDHLILKFNKFTGFLLNKACLWHKKTYKVRYEFRLLFKGIVLM